jgi:DNA-binding transcriptional MerR regulator
MSEQYFNTKTVANCLGINPGTLPAWCNALEKYGYLFKRDNSGKRLFTMTDIELLRAFKVKKSTTTLSIGQIASILLGNPGISVKRSVSNFSESDDSSFCPSCGQKMRNVYGNLLCACN